MYCNECGKENRNDRKFCTNCGASLIDYTKPRENLVMPEEIEKEQNLVAKRNSLTKKFNIALAIILLLAIGLTITTFVFNGTLRLVLGACALASCIIFLIVWRIKVVKIRKLTK